MSAVQVEVRELEMAIRENDEMDRRLVEQEQRMLEIKGRQQGLMDTMADRIDRLYKRWLEIQDRRQKKMQESFDCAWKLLPPAGETRLTPETARVMKLQLEVVEDKVALLATLDKTAQGMHKRACRNGHKLEEVAAKAREMEGRLKKLVDALKNSSNPQEEAKNTLMKEIARLEKAEGAEKEKALQLAADLKKFMGKVADVSEKPNNSSAPAEAISSETLKNGEIVASKPLLKPVATDSLTDASEDQKQ